MKFCINCKHYQETHGSKFARCTRDWHNPVTGTYVEQEHGPPRCIDLRVMTCVNPTSPAYCGPDGAGFEEIRVEEDPCTLCRGAGMIVPKGFTSQIPCPLCNSRCVL